MHALYVFIFTFLLYIYIYIYIYIHIIHKHYTILEITGWRAYPLFFVFDRISIGYLRYLLWIWLERERERERRGGKERESLNAKSKRTFQSWRSGRSRSCLGALRSWRICTGCCISPRRWLSGWRKASTSCSTKYHRTSTWGTWRRIRPRRNHLPGHPRRRVAAAATPARPAARPRPRTNPLGLSPRYIPPCRPSSIVLMRYIDGLFRGDPLVLFDPTPDTAVYSSTSTRARHLR